MCLVCVVCVCKPKTSASTRAKQQKPKLTADAVGEHVALGARRAHAALALLAPRRRALAAAGDAALLARLGRGAFVFVEADVLFGAVRVFLEVGGSTPSGRPRYLAENGVISGSFSPKIGATGRAKPSRLTLRVGDGGNGPERDDRKGGRTRHDHAGHRWRYRCGVHVRGWF